LEYILTKNVNLSTQSLVEVDAVTEAEDIAADPRRARVIEGAMKVFLAYGFARTTMDDIAKAAEMSRPALYLLFKNKTDIFRAIAAMVARRAIDEALIGMMSEIAASPHGAELLDMKSSVADLVAGWRDRFADELTGSIEAEARQSRVDLAARGLSTRQLADMLLDGLEGMKARLSDPKQQRHAAAALIAVIALALKP
jgi:AcrR family transcriptional regulator